MPRFEIEVEEQVRSHSVNTGDVMSRKGNTNGYPYIRAWGLYMGSYDGYIAREQERAREMNAPADATFLRNHPLSPDDPKRHGESDVWARFSELPENTQREIQRIASTGNFKGRGVDIDLILPEPVEES